MQELKTRVRNWGKSLGVVIPKEMAIREGIKRNDVIEFIIAKKTNALENTFGTLKFRRSTDEILKEGDEEAWDE